MPTALIVEDEPQAHQLLAALVAHRGYRTLSAFDGAEALAAVDRERPDVILLDLMLPVVNGYEVCARLKSRKATAAIPIVVVTAVLAAESRARCFARGADEVVHKPYTADEIFEALESAAGRARRLGEEARGGALALDAGDDGEALRGLAHLLNALLAETPIGPEPHRRIGEFLRQCCRGAEQWGARTGRARVATLEHRSFPDRIEFTLIDHAGWLASGELPPPPPGAFDETLASPATGTVVWVWRPGHQA